MADRSAAAAPPPLVLASASPRRRDLLSLLGVPFTVHRTDVDETRWDDEPARSLVERLAVVKAEAGAAAHPGALVIGADTVVAVDDAVLGKPADDHDARRMIELLSGRTHRVLTGLAVVGAADPMTAVEETAVTFAALSATDIEWYLSTGDHHGKAGSYGVQGVAGAFITRLDGSFTNVIGLPLSTLRPMLVSTGFPP